MVSSFKTFLETLTDVMLIAIFTQLSEITKMHCTKNPIPFCYYSSYNLKETKKNEIV